MFPTKDKKSYNLPDSGIYTVRSFSLKDYNGKIGYVGPKKIVVPIDGNDVKAMLQSKERFILYFFDPGCEGSLSAIHKLDSLSKNGEQIMIISLRNNYEAINKVLKHTNFAQYPYYAIVGKDYSDVLLLKQIRFIRDVCAECYNQYKDDLGGADYLLIEKEIIRPIFYKESVQMNLL